MTNHLQLGSHYTQRAASRATSIDGARLRPLLASCSLAALLVGGGAPAAHACYTGPFPYTNSGSIDCIVVNNATVSGGISNSGTIAGFDGIAVGGDARNAGSVTISAFSGGINNSGTISAGA
ncbi:hypothetical protein, partial [Bradyrhizobium tropiciagri]|uniref:hypothetical protein n=1 Tax=Bradyrhizobium tropiciagri TaxID=312253 RepID=UPI000A5E78B7